MMTWKLDDPQGSGNESDGDHSDNVSRYTFPSIKSDTGSTGTFTLTNTKHEQTKAKARTEYLLPFPPALTTTTTTTIWYYDAQKMNRRHG
jgi:hypothetical protein